jgi:hypothetical protein
MPADMLFKFKNRLPHLDAKSFRFFRTGDSAAVIIAGYDYGATPQGGVKKAFAAGIETIQIAQSENLSGTHTR